MKSQVRKGRGIPIASDFDSSEGTPLYVDELTGTVYTRKDDGNIVSGGQLSGSGSPEGVVKADVGSLYVNTAGGVGSTLYVKESGSGTTGWSARVASNELNLQIVMTDDLPDPSPARDGQIFIEDTGAA